MSDMDGWVQTVEKGVAKAVAPKTWVTIATIDDLPHGPTILHAQLYGTLPSTKPKDIRTRWNRLGPSPDDPTGYMSHVVGTFTSWFSKDTDVEYIDGSELPIVLQIYHNGGAAMTVTADIVKVFNPSEYIAQRISVR